MRNYRCGDHLQTGIVAKEFTWSMVELVEFNKKKLRMKPHGVQRDSSTVLTEYLGWILSTNMVVHTSTTGSR